MVYRILGNTNIAGTHALLSLSLGLQLRIRRLALVLY